MEDYEQSSFDFDEKGLEVRYNLDFFAHRTIFKMDAVFDNDASAEDGFLKYRHLVEHLEVIAKAAKYIDEEYDTKVNKQEYENLNESQKSAAIARFKLSLILAGMEKKSPKKDSLLL